MRAHAYDQRAVLSRCKYPSRTVMEHHAKCIRTPDPEHSPGESLQRSARLLVIVIYQLHCDLRVCLRIKRVAGFQQLILQFLVILDYTVVDQNDRPVLRAMRMSIVFRRLTMSSPAGVPDSTGPRYCHASICFFCQDPQAAFCLHDLDVSVGFIADRNSCRIISSVLQLFKSRQKNRGCLPFPYISYNSTHGIILLYLFSSS